MPRETSWSSERRLAGLRRFAIAITVFNLLGHFWFGFEESWAQLFVSLAAAYSAEIALEALDARVNRRKAAYTGGFVPLVNFLLSAHITGLAIAMLLYANDRLWVIAFAAATAIASKSIFRVAAGKGTRHLYNPSNLGITVTLLLFPWVGIAPPYHFTENLPPAGRWIVPAIIIVSGSFLNWRFTRKLPLIVAWLSCFFLQALFRHQFFDASFTGALLPMTGVAFILFTFYMLTDPGTTPTNAVAQIAFGASVALAYCACMLLHIVFGLFFALTAVCTVRGIALYAQSWRRQPAPSEIKVEEALAASA
ncbi:MAG: RnfABCDGE type electron transport complex subunit D [Acidobacteriaceae bacterium]|nr:RnfABCDGE type electron transport complex subunit D [Acidobacteriaceae bacterium]